MEGSEDVVLQESEKLLGNVQHIFCEYHHGSGLPTDRLGKILLLLDKEGFDVNISKSYSYEKSTNKRPLSYLKKRQTVFHRDMGKK